MSLRILATGGTFDKVYDPLSGTLRFADTCIAGLLGQARTDATVYARRVGSSRDDPIANNRSAPS